MKSKVNSLRNFLLMIVFAVAIYVLTGVAWAQDPLEDPAFDPEIHIQPFQTSYWNREIMPQNDTNTGAATHSIGIEVPPGRGGLQPNLALRYNSGQKNGWVGVGWSLALGAIRRSTKWGLNYSADDFTVDGSLELKPRSDWGADYFEPEIEAAFTRYRFVSATGGWIAEARDGSRYFYGTSSDSRQENSKGVFKWCLDRIEDANGNAILVSYSKDQGQIYLNRIDYTDGSHYVLFTLEDRPDAFTQHNTHAAVTTAKRLKQIETYGNGSLARTYELQYELGSFTERSRLLQIKENSLPPIVFFWQDGGSGIFDTAVETETGQVGPEDPREYLTDLNGDGRTDLVRRSTHASIQTYYAYLGRSDGTFGEAVANEIDVMLYEMGTIYFADVNGDGRTDLIKRSTYNNFNVHLSMGDGTFSEAVGTDLDVMAGEMGRIHFADINGDGRSDLILRTTNNLFHIHLADDEGAFGEAVETDLDVMPAEMGDIYFHDINGDNRADLVLRNIYGIFNTHFGQADGSLGSANSTDSGVMPSELGLIYFADTNGDGITDLIKRNNGGTVNCYASLGDGTFGPPTSTETGVKTFESGYIDFSDVNGDGLADLVKHDRIGNYFVHLSEGDGTFGEERGTATGRMIDEKSQVYFADIDGDGLADLFKRSEAGTVHIHRANGKPADLLVDIGSAVDNDPANGFRALTSFIYQPSSQYQNTLLPFIVQTVAARTLAVATQSEDGNDVTSVTGYAYSGGYYDFLNREFRGFQQLIQTNPDSTTVTRQYHQDDYLKGKEALIEVKDPQGVNLIRTTFSWGKEFIDSAQDTIAFVRLDRKDTDFFLDPTVYRQTDYTYDTTHGGLLTATVSGTDAEPVTTTYQYLNYGAWLWRSTVETTVGGSSGKVREIYYDYEAGTGNLLSKEQWLDDGPNPKMTMTYDSYGNLISATDPRGNTTTTEYDALGHTYPARITSPATDGIDHVVEYQDYDYRWGKAKIVKDENSQFTHYSYDDLGRLKTVDYPDGGHVEREYLEHRTPIQVTTRVIENTGGSMMETHTYYDGLYRNTVTISAGEFVAGSNRLVRSDRFFDEMGRNFLSVGPYFDGDNGDIPWRRTVFDDLGRQLEVTSPDPEYGTVSSTFGYHGFNVTTTDPDGARKTLFKDYLGRIIAVVEHADEDDFTTTYDYNAAGNLLLVTAHDRNQIDMQYDTLGRKVQMDDPDMGVWTYAYDANGNLISQSDFKGQEISFAYDELDRVISKTYSTPDPAVTYVYDNLSIPNGRGRLFSVSNTQVTSKINGYDPMGREMSVSKKITGDPTEYFTSYQYDLAGKLTKLTYPDAYEVNYTYSPGSGLLAYIVGSDYVTYAKLSGYAPTGQIGQIEYGGYLYNYNFVTTDQYTYSPLSSRLEKITTRAVGSSDYLQWLEYKYTPAGDIKEKTDVVHSSTYTYAYDKLHRLVEEVARGHFPVPADTTMDYTYDDGYQPHAVKQITLNGSASFDYTYDDNGNMETGPDFTNTAAVTGRTITYNADNMPLSIEHGSGVTTDFVYDGTGARTKKMVSGGATTYYIGEHYEVRDGAAIKYIFAGNRRIAKRTPNQIFYFHRDHLGSSTVMINAYAQQVEYTDFLPFGGQREHTGVSATNYKYTDQELDPSTGLYNYDARLYDPVIGRFTTADSMIPNWFDPQLLNRYSYVRNNPLKFIDPTGHFPGHHRYSGLLMSNQNEPPPRVYEYEGNYKDMETGEIIGAKGLESPILSPGDLISAGGVIKVVAKGGGKLLGRGVVKKADDILVEASNNLLKVPGRVQSRINLQTGTNKFGMKHILKEHLSGKVNKSQFNLTEDGLRQLLQSKQVVNSPIVKTLQSKTHGTLYVRQVDVGRTIGTDYLRGHSSTSILTTQSDMYGNIVTAFPGM